MFPIKKDIGMEVYYNVNPAPMSLLLFLVSNGNQWQ